MLSCDRPTQHMLSWVTRRPGARRSTSAPVITRVASTLRTDRRLLPGYREVERREAIARERPSRARAGMRDPGCRPTFGPSMLFLVRVDKGGHGQLAGV